METRPIFLIIVLSDGTHTTAICHGPKLAQGWIAILRGMMLPWVTWCFWAIPSSTTSLT
jgi:hypothetical protein